MRARFRAVLADDERLARKRLRELLLAHPEIEIIGEAASVQATIDLVARESPDIVFLDIQMPPDCGFDALPQLHPLPRIIFVTAHDTFALRAFEANALDYLLKPVHPDRLAETVRRLHARVSPPVMQPSTAALDPRDLVPLRDKGSLRLVPVAKIAAIQAEAAYSNICIAGQSCMLILKPIHEWEECLPSPPFVRLDRSLLINLSLIRSVEVLTRSKTHVGFEGVKDSIILGRTASTRLKRLLA